jgi:hypothetical protein
VLESERLQQRVAALQDELDECQDAHTAARERM